MPLIVPVLTAYASGNDGWLRRATLCSSYVVVVVAAAEAPPSPLGGMLPTAKGGRLGPTSQQQVGLPRTLIRA